MKIGKFIKPLVLGLILGFTSLLTLASVIAAVGVYQQNDKKKMLPKTLWYSNCGESTKVVGEYDGNRYVAKFFVTKKDIKINYGAGAYEHFYFISQVCGKMLPCINKYIDSCKGKETIK